MLKVAREYLGMDVAFMSRFDAEQRTFVAVDTAGASSPVQVGGSDGLGDSYCHYVATGRIPQFLADAQLDPMAAELAVTAELDIGTHLSVPVVLPDGTVYGTFCCFSSKVEPHVSEQDVTVVKVLADLAAHQIHDQETTRRHTAERRQRLEALDHGQGLVLLRQAIVDLASNQPIGFEALSRFPTMDSGPAEVYAEAWRIGVGQDLEVKAVQAALGHLHDIPATTYLAVNVSPETITDVDLVSLIKDSGGAHRLVVEVTEHAAVRDYDLLLPALDALRAIGVRLAVDDVGTGFSGLDHILRLSPSILKLDGSLVTGIDTSVAKQAMVDSLVTYASRTDARLVAEKVETAQEATALRDLGVHSAQGYYFARPEPFDTATDHRQAV